MDVSIAVTRGRTSNDLEPGPRSEVVVGVTGCDVARRLPDEMSQADEAASALPGALTVPNRTVRVNDRTTVDVILCLLRRGCR